MVVYCSRRYEDEREWVRGIWNVWFDQVYPPTPSSSEDEDDYETQESFQDTSSVNVGDEKSSKKWVLCICSSVPYSHLIHSSVYPSLCTFNLLYIFYVLI